MQRIALLPFLCLAASPLLAQDPFEDGPTGLVVQMPEGWDRDAREEKGSVRFAAIYDLARRKYVLFRVEAGPATGFDADTLLQAENKSLEGYFQKVTTPFKRVPGMRVGGLEAAAYEMAGTVEPEGGESYPLQVRGCWVVKGSVVFKMTQTSFNDAHKECADALDAMWKAISFQEATGALPSEGDSIGGGGGDTAPPAGEPVDAEDKPGNYKVTLPPGWVVVREAPEDDGSGLRMMFERQGSDGTPFVHVRVIRLLGFDPSIFSAETPGSMLNRLQKDNQLMDGWYGEGAGRTLQPHVDEGISFGGAEKAGGFEYRSHTLKEIAEIREAETQVRRGVPGATVPDIKQLVIRGRIALISPHIYIVYGVFDRGVSDHAELLAEFRKVMDAFEFLATKPKPPPCTAAGTVLENTRDDPAFGELRKEETLYVERARKEHKLEVSFVVPPGFQHIKDVGGSVSIIVAAQDKDNNWVRITVMHASAMAAGEQNKVLIQPKQQFEEWKHNWTSKAKGARMKDKPETVNFGGGFSGKGYELAEGTVENFPATFTGSLKDSSGWRTIVEMETMGKGHEVFEDGIKAFFKGLKMKKVK